jgi:uncharacterized repeat protein (TIGR01451 family)
MSYVDAPGPRDYCAHCIAWLSTIAELNCHSPKDPESDQVIVLNMHIYPDDTVKEDKIILRRGKPTNYYQKGDDYNLIITDENGKVIWSQNFNLYFDYMGPVVSGVDYSGIRYAYYPFSYKIPYDRQMYELKLYHEDKVIYTKILNFCNKNGICESTETYLTCPCDCPLNQRDGISIPNSDGVCDPDCAEGVDPDCVVEEAVKIFFSTEEEFITQGPEPPDGNPIISDGDLLCPGGVVFARNRELLAAFKQEHDLGLDAADVIDMERHLVAFSTELDDPEGRFTDGDLLATNGAVIPNIALLAMFDIPSDDLGLDAVHFIGEKDGIVRFLDYVAEKGMAFLNENPNALPELLQQYNIDIWFSTEEGFAPEPKVPLFLDGNLLSARDGNIVAGNDILLPSSVPAGIPSEGVDFGLDAVFADRSGNEENIVFSTEILYEGEASFSDGDVLIFGNGVVRTNEDLIQSFKPKSHSLGLDALAFVAAAEEEEEGEEVCRPSIKVAKTAWDMSRQAWAKESSADVQNTVTFKSVIVNNGTCGPLYNIKVTDILSDSLEYANYAQVNSEPREPDAVNDKELTWLFDGPLNPNETITISYNARVVNCGEDENVQRVEAVCEKTGQAVLAEDRAIVIVPCEEVRKPDLVITDIGAVGEVQSIYYSLKNQGNAEAGPSWTELRIDGVHIMKDPVGSLATGAIINRTFDYTPDCPAGEEVEITVCADIGIQVDESDEGNNCRTERFRCPTAILGGEIIYHADYGAGIWRMNPDGTGRTQLSDHGWFAEYSPDNTKIAFGEYYHNGIWVMNADGTNAHQISKNPGSFPKWSPNGNRIAYHGEANTGIWLINSDGTGETLLYMSGGYPAWSPDGKKIAYSSLTDWCIWTMNADATGKEKVTDRKGINPTWSSDGTKIAYEDLTKNKGIWVVNADGSDDHMINEEGHAPDWSMTD